MSPSSAAAVGSHVGPGDASTREPRKCQYPRCKAAATGRCGQCREDTCAAHAVHHIVGPIFPITEAAA